jgi:hypothetical protein
VREALTGTLSSALSGVARLGAMRVLVVEDEAASEKTLERDVVTCRTVFGARPRLSMLRASRSTS